MTSLCETSKKNLKKDRKALQVQPSSPYFTRHDIKKELQEIQEYINQLGNILDNKTALSRWYNEVIEYKIIDERKQFPSSDADLELPPDDAKYHKEDMKLITEAQQRLYTLAEKLGVISDRRSNYSFVISTYQFKSKPSFEKKLVAQ